MTVLRKKPLLVGGLCKIVRSLPAEREYAAKPDVDAGVDDGEAGEKEDDSQRQRG